MFDLLMSRLPVFTSRVPALESRLPVLTSRVAGFSLRDGVLVERFLLEDFLCPPFMDLLGCVAGLVLGVLLLGCVVFGLDCCIFLGCDGLDMLLPLFAPPPL
jgi:hypothetical protein